MPILPILCVSEKLDLLSNMKRTFYTYEVILIVTSLACLFKYVTSTSQCWTFKKLDNVSIENEPLDSRTFENNFKT